MSIYQAVSGLKIDLKNKGIFNYDYISGVNYKKILIFFNTGVAIPLKLPTEFKGFPVEAVNYQRGEV